jgi:hypothetical protein
LFAYLLKAAAGAQGPGLPGMATFPTVPPRASDNTHDREKAF